MLEEINNKEMKIIEILSITMHLFMKNFKKILIVVALIFFPISILNVLIVERLSTSIIVLLDLIATKGLLDNMSVLIEAYLDLMRNNMLLMAVSVFLEPVGIIAIAIIVKGYLYNETIHLREAIGEAMNCLWKIIVAGLISSILIILATICFIIPGIYLGIIWTFYVYAIGLRGYKGWKALAYSKKLIDGRFWKTLGFLIVISFIAVLCNKVMGSVFYLLPKHIATDILYDVLTYFYVSFECIALTVLFMNREVVLLGEKHNTTECTGESKVDEDV
ncbi:MAG: hypothetical protein PHU31_00485 [Anaerotignum sp.]|nr:hypothetical protein [Anaerotignum sp.]